MTCTSIFVYKTTLPFYNPSWSHGSLIYNYLCNQCLSPLMLRVRIQLIWVCSIQIDVIKFVSVLTVFRQVDGFLLVLRLHGWSLVPCLADVMIKVCYWTVDHRFNKGPLYYIYIFFFYAWLAEKFQLSVLHIYIFGTPVN